MDTTVREPAKIGEILVEEFLKPLNITQAQLAQAMGFSRKTVSEICTSKRRLSVDDSIMLGDLFETSAEFWINLQAAHDRWEARQKHAHGNVTRPIVEILGRTSSPC